MSEPSLLDIQRGMKSWIHPESGAPAAPWVRDLLNPQRGTAGVDRLSVYAGGYRTRTREALEQIYQAVHHLVGDRAFARLAEMYAARVPSHDYNLNLRGRELPQFLATDPLTDSFPFLPDLARLEWQICCAFHASEQPPRDLRELAHSTTEEWARLCLQFQPSVAVVESVWPVLDLWNARTQPVEQIAIDVINRPQRVLTFRDGVTVRCELIDEQPATLLIRLLNGQPLGQACEPAAGQAALTPSTLTAWFGEWAARGLINGWTW